MTVSIDLQAARTALLEEQNKLVHQLSELGATEEGELRSDVEFGDGFADAGAATAERTEVLGLIDSLKRQLDDAVRALSKLDDGTYGSCTACGKEIGVARMEARPSSVYCVDCKKRRS